MASVAIHFIKLMLQKFMQTNFWMKAAQLI